MPRFDPPEAAWTDEYEWTRYRGPQPYPVPADWVLRIVEGDGIGWYRFPGLGEGLAKDTEVRDVLGIGDDYEDALAEADEAWLDYKIVEAGGDGFDPEPDTVEHTLTIAGETVFRRVDPDRDDLMAAVAETLSKFTNGAEWRAVEPSTGRLPDDLKREQELERRRERNASLDGFGGADG